MEEIDYVHRDNGDRCMEREENCSGCELTLQATRYFAIFAGSSYFGMRYLPRDEYVNTVEYLARDFLSIDKELEIKSGDLEFSKKVNKIMNLLKVVNRVKRVLKERYSSQDIIGTRELKELADYLITKGDLGEKYTCYCRRRESMRGLGDGIKWAMSAGISRLHLLRASELEIKICHLEADLYYSNDPAWPLTEEQYQKYKKERYQQRHPPSAL